MKKTLCLLILAAAVIVCAFAAPSLALRASVERVMQSPKLTDASAYVIQSAGNTVQKLNALRDPNAVSIKLSPKEPFSASDQIDPLTAVLKELAALKELGAITQALYEPLCGAVSDALSVDLFCIIQPDQHLVFELYSIRFWNCDSRVILDAETGKVLTIHFCPIDRGLFVQEYGDVQGTRELDGWASYFGLKAEAPSFTTISPELFAQLENPDAPVRVGVMKCATLMDESGNCVDFGMLYDFSAPEIECYTWAPIE